MKHYEYSIFHINGDEYIRYHTSGDTEAIMEEVLAEFDESEIDTVTLKLVPREAKHGCGG